MTTRADEKLNCGNCEFFKVEVGGRRMGAGMCRRHPPRLNHGAVVFPGTTIGEFCGEHSDYRGYELRGAIAHGFTLYRQMMEEVKYDPSKFGDATAAGFNKAPSVADAMRLSQMASQTVYCKRCERQVTAILDDGDLTCSVCKLIL